MARPGKNKVAILFIANAGTENRLVAIFNATRVSDSLTFKSPFSVFQWIMCIPFDVERTVESSASDIRASHFCWCCTRSERFVICDVVPESNKIRSGEDLAPRLPKAARCVGFGVLLLSFFWGTILRKFCPKSYCRSSSSSSRYYYYWYGTYRHWSFLIFFWGWADWRSSLLFSWPGREHKPQAFAELAADALALTVLDVSVRVSSMSWLLTDSHFRPDSAKVLIAAVTKASWATYIDAQECRRRTYHQASSPWTAVVPTFWPSGRSVERCHRR